MAITLNGTGSISGLTSGAGIAATALSGQVPDANAPSGSVIQVVFATTATETSTSSTTVWSDTTLTASITPSNANNKILVIFSQNGVNRQTNAGGVEVRLLRDSTALNEYAGIYGAAWQGGAISSENGVGSVSAEHLDSPNTTSSVTYKTQLQAGQGGQAIVQHGSATSTMVLMEIAG